MDPLDHARKAIRQVFARWEAIPGPQSDFRFVGVIDAANDRYVLQDVDLSGGRYRSQTLAHLEVRDGKVWVLTDNTEEGIATELVALGVPKGRIVLAFYPPSLRELGEFAVA